MKAKWNGRVVAQSDDTVVVEANHYFPAESIDRRYFAASATRTHCPWKGEAHYYSLIVDGHENRDAAWFYPSPKQAARQIEGRVAFWKDVVVEP